VGGGKERRGRDDENMTHTAMAEEKKRESSQKVRPNGELLSGACVDD